LVNMCKKGSCFAVCRLRLYKIPMALPRVVADSSSIILLQKVGLLDVFLEKYRVAIPNHVYDELTEGGKDGTNELVNLLEDKIVQSADVCPIEGLDRGESSVIALYHSGLGDFVVLDDKKGAKYCRAHAIPFINALLVSRILFLAGAIKEEDHRSTTALLVQEGYYSDMIIKKAAAIRNIDLQAFTPL
jgi:predicted nucleic acid-binding protein